MRNTLFLIALVLIAFGSGCTPFLIDGPYEGYVVDADTGEPIEGAVVAMSWYTWTPTIAGMVYSCYDSDEAATDKMGHFRLPGKGWRLFSDIGKPSFVIVKEGYWMAKLDLSNKARRFLEEIINLHSFYSDYKGYFNDTGVLCRKGDMHLYNTEYSLVLHEMATKKRGEND